MRYRRYRESGDHLVHGNRESHNLIQQTEVLIEDGDEFIGGVEGEDTVGDNDGGEDGFCNVVHAPGAPNEGEGEGAEDGEGEHEDPYGVVIKGIGDLLTRAAESAEGVGGVDDFAALRAARRQGRRRGCKIGFFCGVHGDGSVVVDSVPGGTRMDAGAKAEDDRLRVRG